MKNKHKPYWKMGYCKIICSECAFVAKEEVRSIRKDFCPSCNADMREPLKRCYYIENHGGETYCPCGESHYCHEDRLLYCTHYKALSRQRMGNYWFPCDDIRLKTTESIQLSFFDE